MSKLSFRARQLDASKPMPVYRAEEIPDLPDFQAINRAVPQMPTGMEKEEECVSIISLARVSSVARTLNSTLVSFSIFFARECTSLLFTLPFSSLFV